MFRVFDPGFVGGINEAVGSGRVVVAFTLFACVLPLTRVLGFTCVGYLRWAV